MQGHRPSNLINSLRNCPAREKRYDIGQFSFYHRCFTPLVPCKIWLGRKLTWRSTIVGGIGVRSNVSIKLNNDTKLSVFIKLEATVPLKIHILRDTWMLKTLVGVGVSIYTRP